MNKYLIKLLQWRLNIYRYIFSIWIIKKVKILIIKHIDIIWKLTIIFLWFIGYITKFALIKELTFILLIIFLAMYSIEKDLFFIKKTEIKEYILYIFCLLDFAIIILIFFDNLNIFN